MTATPYDRRQLVAARGKLERALFYCEIAVDRIPEVEAELRVNWAMAEAESALTELRRYTRRHLGKVSADGIN